MDSKQFEQQLVQQLRRTFAGPNDPMLPDRKRKLVALFHSLTDPALVAIYSARLVARVKQDALSNEFHDRLSTALTDQLLNILHGNSNKIPATPVRDKPTFRLIDRDSGGERRIATDDQEFLDNYIDFHIVEATSDPDPRTIVHHTMIVKYSSGRTLELPFYDVPARLRSYSPDDPNARFARSRFDNLTPDAYLLTGGMILPVDHHNEIMYNDTFTPNLIDIRTTMEFNIRQRSRVLELAQMTVAFAGSVGALGGFYNPSGVHVTKSGGQWRGLPHVPRKVKPDVSLQRRGPVKAGPHLVQQRRKITTPDMLKWENEGGHTLQRHSWQLTSDKLKERVLGREKFMDAPQMQRGGIKPPDYRVWRGKKNVAASKWADQSTMHKAMGDVIDNNLVEIRRLTKGGDEIVLNNKPFGSKTGEGWVTTGGTPGDVRGAFYNRELTGVTIVIRPRENHTPTPQDPEGWYVFTAFPDAAK